MEVRIYKRKSAGSLPSDGTTKQKTMPKDAGSEEGLRDNGFMFFVLAVHEHVREKMLREEEEEGSESREVGHADVLSELERRWNEMDLQKRKQWQISASVYDTKSCIYDEEPDDEINFSQSCSAGDDDAPLNVSRSSGSASSGCEMNSEVSSVATIPDSEYSSESLKPTDAYMKATKFQNSRMKPRSDDECTTSSANSVASSENSVASSRSSRKKSMHTPKTSKQGSRSPSWRSKPSKQSNAMPKIHKVESAAVVETKAVLPSIVQQSKNESTEQKGDQHPQALQEMLRQHIQNQQRLGASMGMSIAGSLVGQSILPSITENPSSHPSSQGNHHFHHLAHAAVMELQPKLNVSSSLPTNGHMHQYAQSADSPVLRSPMYSQDSLALINALLAIQLGNNLRSLHGLDPLAVAMTQMQSPNLSSLAGLGGHTGVGGHIFNLNALSQAQTELRHPLASGEDIRRALLNPVAQGQAINLHTLNPANFSSPRMNAQVAQVAQSPAVPFPSQMSMQMQGYSLPIMHVQRCDSASSNTSHNRTTPILSHSHPSPLLTPSSMQSNASTALVSESPQVRTLTIVCDMFFPHKGQVNLGILAQRCQIRKSGPGIMGLSCQYKDESGEEKVVVRGQVKDAKRHFAHQAQLRLSLPGSPNISVKLFSNGRLQIAGCREEAVGVSAVRAVAEAVNQIMWKDASVIRRQFAAGPNIGQVVEGMIDLSSLPPAKIVMINCSFDSGFEQLGYGLDPWKLTSALRNLQNTDDKLENVEYTPEQHYTGVKVKYRTRDGLKKRKDDKDMDETQISKEVFIGIFPSGKCVLTGATAWEEVDAAYQFIRSVLAGHFEHVRIPASQLRRRRNKQSPANTNRPEMIETA